MTRLIGGAAGGRRLRTPPGSGTRPTSDRVREAMFSSLESALGSLEGLRVLDLYAGSGALGLEAVSRGAQVLTSVESDRRTARLVQDNARELGFAMVEVVALPVARFLAQQPRAAYDLVLVDPPYAVAEVELGQVLHLLTSHGWLDADAVLVVERSARSPEPAWPPGWGSERRKDYGETTLWYVRADPGRPDAGESHCVTEP
ncbi:16S rRNA (guanine(966)-N(2))-methyltransferase RsmD [Nocardioides aurantiacus]|uniref:16S rRNA (Guanine966-N2)-methyltransferase n=1 Tax=Nocardioides aurantiacus TaxID=86796 RepID=A0A3N2CXB3_9ACTN|nr:16S rRNA (guanine(966)-N(2))-methyltransferase RsmD [Nocardioides aurantiacus]ROR92177.1 16S rRNA (guanine966-N2)-methyltransferase [Nocardioides aurantiacus]